MRVGLVVVAIVAVLVVASSALFQVEERCVTNKSYFPETTCVWRVGFRW
jgi:hypothetical protein